MPGRPACFHRSATEPPAVQQAEWPAAPEPGYCPPDARHWPAAASVAPRASLDSLPVQNCWICSANLIDDPKAAAEHFLLRHVPKLRDRTNCIHRMNYTHRMKNK